MTEHPILFSAPMVRAFLADRKTQTRRLLKPQPGGFPGPCLYGPSGLGVWTGDPNKGSSFCTCVPIPLRWKRGDTLWVREAHYLTDNGDYEQVVYAADDDGVRAHFLALDGLPRDFSSVVLAGHKKLRPSIHMPRWASRITLLVTDVRVQRLQDISEDDARAEGVEQETCGLRTESERDWGRCKFGDLWESINGAGWWNANPWVAAITFERLA